MEAAPGTDEVTVGALVSRGRHGVQADGTLQHAQDRVHAAGEALEAGGHRPAAQRLEHNTRRRVEV